MVKLVFCIHRQPHLTREEFLRYWLDEHGRLALALVDDLRVRRYVQLHTIDTPLNDLFGAPRQAPEPFDGIVELWFDSLEVVEQMILTTEGRRAGKLLLDDERTFIDLERSQIFFGEEHQLVPADGFPAVSTNRA
ncbi:MAG: hypothetical protein ACI89G_000452 [Minisyncoccia bacterium]|jgi:hypothetical protein|tara:strand:- start:231 stop:635 length:405 start_codon:yes stop_codon:yes gene_type:complete